MKQIGTHPVYGAVYNSPGGSGGEAMIFLEGRGWIKNPNYGKTDFGGGGGNGLVKVGFGCYRELKQ